MENRHKVSPDERVSPVSKCPLWNAAISCNVLRSPFTQRRRRVWTALQRDKCLSVRRAQRELSRLAACRHNRARRILTIGTEGDAQQPHMDGLALPLIFLFVVFDPNSSAGVSCNL